MYEEIGVDLLRKFDPYAVGPLIIDSPYYHFFKRVLDVVVAA